MIYTSASQENAVRNTTRAAQQQIKKETGIRADVAISPSGKGKTPEQMLTVIAMALDMDPATYRVRSRERAIVELRFLGALFLRSSFPLITLQQIASLFGGQDHSSVISGLSRANDLISCRDDRFLEKYNIVSQTVRLWITEN